MALPCHCNRVLPGSCQCHYRSGTVTPRGTGSSGCHGSILLQYGTHWQAISHTHKQIQATHCKLYYVQVMAGTPGPTGRLTRVFNLTVLHMYPNELALTATLAEATWQILPQRYASIQNTIQVCLIEHSEYRRLIHFTGTDRLSDQHDNRIVNEFPCVERVQHSRQPQPATCQCTWPVPSYY